MSEDQGSYAPANIDLRQPSERQAGGPPLIVFVGLASIGLLALIVVIYLFAGDPNGLGTPGAVPVDMTAMPTEGAAPAPTEGAAPMPEATPMPEAAPTEGAAPMPEATPMPEAAPTEDTTSTQ
jgi:hypothetical protein